MINDMKKCWEEYCEKLSVESVDDLQLAFSNALQYCIVQGGDKDRIDFITFVQEFKLIIKRLEKINEKLLNDISFIDKMGLVRGQHEYKECDLVTLKHIAEELRSKSTRDIISKLKPLLDSCYLLLNKDDVILYDENARILTTLEHVARIRTSLPLFDVESWKSRKSNIESTLLVHQATYQKLVIILNNKFGSGCWKNALLKSIHVNPMRFFGEKFIVEQGLEKPIEINKRFKTRANTDTTVVMGSSYADDSGTSSVTSLSCLDSDYSVIGCGATADGYTHPRDVDLADNISRVGYFSAKNLVRLALRYTNSTDLYNEIPGLFRSTSALVKSKLVLNDVDAGMIFTRAFLVQQNKMRIVTGSVGDCLALAWEPNLSKVTILANPRQYRGIGQFNPIGINSLVRDDQIVRSTYDFSTDVVIVRLTDGAWEYLPQLPVLHQDSSARPYFEAKIDTMALETLFTKWMDGIHSQPQAQLARSLLNYIAAKLEENRELLVALKLEMKALLEQYESFSQTLLSTFSSFQAWVEENTNQKSTLERFIKENSYIEEEIATMPISVLKKHLEAKQSIGDDVTIAVSSYRAEDLAFDRHHNPWHLGFLTKMHKILTGKSPQESVWLLNPTK